MKEPINIPIDMEVKVKATLNLTNTETGEVQTMSIGAPEGMILNHYLDWAMERGLGLLGTTTFNRCYLGTGNTPVQPTDTGLSGSQLAMSSSSVLTKNLDNPLDYEHLNTIEGLNPSLFEGLASTLDENLLIVADDTSASGGLQVFEIDKETWTLSPISVEAFEELSGIGCRALSISENYLFVGLNQPPWGKVYKINNGTFEFFADVPGLVDFPRKSDIHVNEMFLAVMPRDETAGVHVYLIEETSISAIGIAEMPYSAGMSFSRDDNYLCVSGDLGSWVGMGSRVYAVDELSVTYLQDILGTVNLSESNRDTSPFFVGKDIYLSSRTGTGSASNRVIAFARQSSEGVWRDAVPLGAHLGDYFATGFGLMRSRGCIFSFAGGDLYPLGNPAVRNNFPVLSVNAPLSAWTVLESLGIVFCVNSAKDIMIIKIRNHVSSKQSYARKWTFPAGTGTGVVNEIAVQATSGTGDGGNNRYFLRFVLPEGFEKTDLHQLEVEVEAEVENPGVWEGVIPGGNRDGSDVRYRITMSEDQFRNFIRTGYNNLSTWFGTSGTPEVRIGTSNEETDLVLDRENIRGRQIQYISSTAIREIIPYVPGSLERTIRLFLEIDQGNGKIGEIVFGNGFCRVTFDPPLNKYDPEGVDAGRDPSTRLYMNLVFGWKREGE
jgi:hypothetical protein